MERLPHKRRLSGMAGAGDGDAGWSSEVAPALPSPLSWREGGSGLEGKTDFIRSRVAALQVCTCHLESTRESQCVNSAAKHSGASCAATCMVRGAQDAALDIHLAYMDTYMETSFYVENKLWVSVIRHWFAGETVLCLQLYTCSL